MTYRSGEARSVLQPYDWLPGHGANDIEYTYKDGQLELKILYDDMDLGKEVHKTIFFLDVCDTHIGFCPGVNCMNINYTSRSGAKGLSDLNVYDDSEAAHAWCKHFGWPKGTVKHYQIFFNSANYLVDVFAKGFRVE